MNDFFAGKLANKSISILIFFFILFTLCSFVGFPIILPDSRRYLGAASIMQLSTNAPTLFPFLLRPLYILFGPWAFVLVNCAIASTLSINISRLLYKHDFWPSMIVSLIFSTFLLNMTFVMMDVHVVFAIISLYLLVIDSNNLTTKIILGLCLISHNSSILITFIVAFILYLITLNNKFILSFFLIFIISLLSLTAFNYKLENRLNPLPRHASQFLTARLLVDIPEAMDSFIISHPDSAFSPHWKNFQEKYQHELSTHDDITLEHIILWSSDGILLHVGKDKVAKESFQFTLHVIANYPFKYISSLINNFITFFDRFIDIEYKLGSFSGWNGYDFSEFTDKYFPSQRQFVQFGVQHFNRIAFFYSASLTTAIFIISVIFNAGIIVAYSINRKINKNIFMFSVICFIFMFTNAFVSANFGVNTSDGRFAVKPYWPFMLNLFLFLEDFIRKLKRKSCL